MTKLTDETIKGDCYVSLIRDNEDGSSDFQFNFPPEALAALTRLGILTAINAGIAEAECLNPDTLPPKQWVGLTVDEVWKNDQLMSLNAELGCDIDLLMKVIKEVEAAHDKGEE